MAKTHLENRVVPAANRLDADGPGLHTPRTQPTTCMREGAGADTVARFIEEAGGLEASR